MSRFASLSLSPSVGLTVTSLSRIRFVLFLVCGSRFCVFDAVFSISLVGALYACQESGEASTEERPFIPAATCCPSHDHDKTLLPECRLAVDHMVNTSLEDDHKINFPLRPPVREALIDFMSTGAVDPACGLPLPFEEVERTI